MGKVLQQIGECTQNHNKYCTTVTRITHFVCSQFTRENNTKRLKFSEFFICGS